ncbi:conserved Plasmodium protein, unknown function [Babesia microti strain RI]|uniref:VPS9 domain-containing protein n=1 Tax=Babesia microti (strain RI) TaxID=1133968 RepID=A0A1R4AB46_BABMR|nr:conserved Plasmodium protein, unknown function [Babesia microti strain RI]SJK86231.1 conserved Plasmodium protein, unknown function [Babesia microti strain RI]|eukprot:XP_021338414.1 conserved Plasmodium protein, unknown function [Babesia microti strain RI]
MDAITSHPLLCVLNSRFPDTMRESFKNQCILLLPSPNSLVGVKISKSLIGKLYLNRYVTLDGRGVRVDEDGVSTEFGFKEARTCNILQHTEIIRDTTLKVITIDRPLVGKFEKWLDEYSLIEFVGSDYTPQNIRKSVYQWSHTNNMIAEKLFAEITLLRKTLLMITGFEAQVAKIIYSVCESTISDSSNPQKWKLLGIIHRFIYCELHDCIWKHLKHIYSAMEGIIINNIKITGPESALSAYKFQSSLNIIPAAMELKKIESCICPFQKVNHLTSSFTLIRQASRSIVEIDTAVQDLLSICIVALIASGLEDKLAHAAHMDMAIQGSPEYEFDATTRECIDCFNSALKCLTLTT